METEPVNFLEGQSEVRPQKSFFRRHRRLILFFTIPIFLFAGFLSARAIWGEQAPNDPMAYDPVSLEPKKPEGLLRRIKQIVFYKENSLAGEKDDRVNILLMGMGGIGHDGPFLTDTMMLASFRPSTKQVALLSIPRDLGVHIPNYGLSKINHANAYGEKEKTNWGAAFATEIVEKTLDIDIHYYIRLDFKAFSEIVDEIGGVNVNVEKAFTDYSFPAENEQFQTVSFQSGTQKMNGDRALTFARSRHGNNGEGSDFARAKRQQKILVAIKEKILSYETFLNPVRINGIVNSLDKHLTTNMEFSDMITFAKLSREIDGEKIKHFVLDNGVDGFLQNGTTSAGGYILTPKDGDFSAIKEMVKNILNLQENVGMARNTAPTGEEPRHDSETIIEIQNGTWQPGLAARIKKRLEDAGFVIQEIGNTAAKPQEKSMIYQVKAGDYSKTIDDLQRELRAPFDKVLPPNFIPTEQTSILIILGEDIQE